MDRVNKGLKKLDEVMEAGDIKKIRIHHRTTKSDLSWVKGTIKGSAGREGWSKQQMAELYEMIHVRVLEVKGGLRECSTKQMCEQSRNGQNYSLPAQRKCRCWWPRHITT